MKYDKKKFDKNLIRIKKLVVTAEKTKNKRFYGVIEMLTQELCLVFAKFRCQKCKSPDKLHIHHLIMRWNKGFMDEWQYYSQRHYWANQVVLCTDCHNKWHNIINNNTDMVISKKTISKIKGKYKWEK